MRPLFGFTLGMLVSAFAVASQASTLVLLVVILMAVLLSATITPAGTFTRIGNTIAAALGCLMVVVHPLVRVVPQATIPTEITGDICSPIRTGTSSVRFTVCTSSGKYVIRTKPGLTFSYLDRVRVSSDFALPEPPRNIGEFDYQTWCRVHHVRAISKPDAKVEVFNTSHNYIGKFVSSVRMLIDQRCKSGLPSDTAPLASGILLSITDDLPYELQEAFGKTGTVHVLSTSGMHISVLVASVSALFFWTGRPATAATGIGLSLLIGYACGGGPAPIRAVTSLVARIGARILMRPAEPWHLLFLCACTAMIRDPFVVMDAGAQLSFMAVAGLLVAAPFANVISVRIRQTSSLSTKVLLTLTQGMFVSFLVTVITAPTVAYHMQHLSLISPIANLPVGLLSEWALLVGSLAVLIGGVPALGLVLWTLLHGILTGLILVANVLAELPFADVATGVLSPHLVIVMNIVLTSVLIRFGKDVSKGLAVSEPSYHVPWSPTKPQP